MITRYYANRKTSASSTIRTLSTEASSKVANAMVSVSCSTINLASTKVSGPPMRETAVEWSVTLTVIDMKVSSKMENRMEKVFIRGRMEKSMKVSGLAVSNKAKESGKVYMVTLTSDSGTSPRPQGTASICGRTATGTKVNGKIV